MERTPTTREACKCNHAAEQQIIYLDNAATSHFKPKEVFSALTYDLNHSANSGRSGHYLALDAAMRIENARRYLLSTINADESYELAFTKNCTEALNLGIWGFITDGMNVVVDANAHNSALRPLFELQRGGKIQLGIAKQEFDGRITAKSVQKAVEDLGGRADLIVLTAASNVTGAIAETEAITEYSKYIGAKILIDGAQAVPITEFSLASSNADMLAVPGHKGLHGVQGSGFLISKRDLLLKPLLFGGTGTSSSNVYQPDEIPEKYESGTLFSGGISALQEGANWTYGNLTRYRLTVKTLAEELIKRLKAIGATVYTADPTTGIVAFNIGNLESGYVADKLNERGFAVRSGFHCAPLVHKFLGTGKAGAVRVSFGVDNTQKDVYSLISALEEIQSANKTVK